MVTTYKPDARSKWVGQDHDTDVDGRVAGLPDGDTIASVSITAHPVLSTSSVSVNTGQVRINRRLCGSSESFALTIGGGRDGETYALAYTLTTAGGLSLPGRLLVRCLDAGRISQQAAPQIGERGTASIDPVSVDCFGMGLAGGDTISSVTIAAHPILTFGSATINAAIMQIGRRRCAIGQAFTFNVSGGRDGETYAVNFTITTTGGQTGLPVRIYIRCFNNSD